MGSTSIGPDEGSSPGVSERPAIKRYFAGPGPGLNSADEAGVWPGNGKLHIDWSDRFSVI